MLCASATLLFLCCNQVATAARMLKTRRSHKAWTWRYRIHLVEDCKTKQKNMQSYFGIKTGLGPIIKRIPLFNWRSSIYTILHWVIGIRRKLIRPCQPLPSHNGCRKICGVVLDLLGFRHPLQSPCNESAMNVKLSNDFNGEGGFARDQTCCSIDMSVKKEKKGKKIDSHQSHHSHVILMSFSMSFSMSFYIGKRDLWDLLRSGAATDATNATVRLRKPCSVQSCTAPQVTIGTRRKRLGTSKKSKKSKQKRHKETI